GRVDVALGRGQRCRGCVVPVGRSGDGPDPVGEPAQDLLQGPRVPGRDLRRNQSPAAALDGLDVALDPIEVARVNDVSRLPVRFRVLPPLRCGAHRSSPHYGREKAALWAAGSCTIVRYSATI